MTGARGMRGDGRGKMSVRMGKGGDGEIEELVRVRTEGEDCRNKEQNADFKYVKREEGHHVGMTLSIIQ